MKLSRKTGLLLASIASVAAIVLYEAQMLQKERARQVALRGRVAAGATELTALQRANEAAQREVAEAERQLAALAPTASAAEMPTPQASERNAWLARVKQLMQHFAEHPDQRIPEMRFLDESNWLRATFEPFQTRVEFRTALAALRSAAQGKFGEQASAALQRYSKATDDTLPADVGALAPYFDPPVEPAMLARYEIIRYDPYAGGKGPLAVRLRAPVDAAYDSRPTYFDGGMSNSSAMNAWNPDFNARQRRGIDAYRRANPGKTGMPLFIEFVRFFDPPLPADVIEQVEYRERKNSW